MSLIKKIFFGIFIALAIGISIWAYISLKNSKKPKVDAISLLPDNCLVYVNTNDFIELNKKINSQSLIADKLKLFGEVNLFCNTLNQFDSLFTENTSLKEMMDKNTIHFALYEPNLNWLTTFNIKRLGNQDLMILELVKILNAKKIENDIYEFNLKSNSKFYFTINDGVAIISNAPEAILLSLNKGNVKIQTNKQFLEFKSTLEENALVSIYVNHNLFLKSKISTKFNLSSISEKGFSAGSIGIEPSNLSVNGYIKPDKSEIISAFSDQEPQTPDFFNLLPNATVAFNAYGFSSFEKLNQQINKIQPNQNQNYWKMVADSALFNIENEFYQNAGNYLVNFETKTPDKKYIILKITDSIKTTEHLGFMSDSVFSKDSIIIYKLKSKGLKTSLKLFNSYFNTSTSYATLYHSTLFFSEGKTELSELILDLKNGSSITKNESFAIYKNQNLSENFNYLVYLSPNKNKQEIKTVFNFSTNTNKNPFQNFKHFSYSLCNNNTNFKFRSQLTNEAETINKGQNVLWTLKLDAPSTMPVNHFRNHITNENELVIQDDDKNLYLINAKGTILWKKKINEKLSSKIFTVDMFKNNKYQLLFSSENYLHLIDRNGNYVQGYPVKLPAASTSELSVIDYDNDKDYRLFIACKNKLIYNYSIFGVKQDKFALVKTDNEIKLPIQYAKVGLSDYLIAVDVEGKIYTFSRKGEGRIGLKNKTLQNCSAFYVDATNNINSTYLIYIDDKNNLINKISFADKKTIEKLNANIDSASIRFCTLEDNNITDIIVTKPNAILSFNLNGEKTFEKTFDEDLSETNYFTDENTSIFFSFSANKKELILFDKLKQKTKSFNATSLPFVGDLFNDNKKYIIITEGNQINCVAF